MNTALEPSGSSNSSPISLSGSLPTQNPTVPVTVLPTPSASDYRWFYEGFAGWWQYEDRTSEELESAFSKNLPSCEVQVAGYIYTIDFVHMTQKRKDNSGRKRRIKRDLKDCEKKGIAGIKLSAIELKPVEINSGASSSVARSPHTQDNPGISAASSGNLTLGEDIFQATSRLSLSTDSPRPVCSTSNADPIQRNQSEMCAPPPVTRSRPATRSNRSPSLTRPSPSPIPRTSRNRYASRDTDGSRACGSRISRSVPRD
ncbi:unnamed protein product [Echinostoma caproni]|uniref:E3 ubiquitin-protein ligase n=1 Tax=Echinostoma caproni TaxID=27848 RepID=A0A3P8GJL9_9TREM|nr:unnamed protein product [Echinostoma caproni]